jgi:hypothetical protein
VIVKERKNYGSNKLRSEALQLQQAELRLILTLSDGATKCQLTLIQTQSIRPDGSF